MDRLGLLIMLDDNQPTPTFYLSNEVPCPYLPDRNERRIFTVVDEPATGIPLYNELSGHGFRRMSQMLYRTHCHGCASCHSVRIRVREFAPSRSQRKILNRNRHLLREIKKPVADINQHRLFCKYLKVRHDESMSEMDYDGYASMVERSPVATSLVKYFDKSDIEAPRADLVAVSLTDLLSDGLSMVYSFFDPDDPRESLGTHMILDHVELCREYDLEYVYLGFWVPGSRKMSYKTNFAPLDIYEDGSWKDFGPRGDAIPDLQM